MYKEDAAQHVQQIEGLKTMTKKDALLRELDLWWKRDGSHAFEV
jgi:hypothetical protein